jgi:Replication-relaxation
MASERVATEDFPGFLAVTVVLPAPGKMRTRPILSRRNSTKILPVAKKGYHVMKPKRTTQPAHPPLMLTPREEDIVRAVATYRFVTARDVTHVFFSPGSLTYARHVLARLCGGREYVERQYLFRFPMASPRRGSPEQVYTLGALGREWLESLGQPVDWYYRPSRAGRLSHSHVQHHLLLTRVVCAAQFWCRTQAAYSLVDVRLGYELARNPLLAKSAPATGERGGSLAAIPDAWLLVERAADHARFPLLLEVDRGTEAQEHFRNHVKARLAFIGSGDYAKVFHTPAVVIGYLTTGQSERYRETRVKTMVAWTRDVLSELKMERWAGLFRFTSVVYDSLYEEAPALFTQPLWYRPDAPSTPGALLTP